MLMLLHDRMPSFMNFIRVLDLLEFKNQASQCFAGNQQWPGVWNSFPSLAWALEIHSRTHMWFFNQLWCTGACACSSNLNYAHKCIETQLMHKNVKTSPEKSKNWHNTPVVLSWHEKFFESNKRQWISFRPQRWGVPYWKPSCLLWESPICEKHIPKPTPDGTNFLPRHVDAAPW